ncbi:MAG: amino acid permease [Deltaproteobacteria bacterium]|nr:amino acid permease [Deltaproteobacteria bacterium]MBW1859947.1 amino acid permease [Deltaproteobacteria bacterium]
MSRRTEDAGTGRFGTFRGVFIPSTLTILGIILFLRVGWVVGQAGLIGAFTIILIANSISLLTGLSLSSIATNMNVKTGGSYYMITRTLGLEIGGAIGIPLFLSLAISVAFYIIGFTEAFTAVFPGLDPKVLSTALVLAFGFLAYMGADFALKIQIVILAVLVLAILSFFAGDWSRWLTPRLFAPSGSSAGFGAVFAIFFPAVTGIMVGVSMSGDLKNPARSIPRGTLAAIGVTAFIYLATAFWLGTHATTQELLTDNMIMQKIARWPVLILLGVWVCTLSSALGSILAAPRILQALSFDRVVPRTFASQLGSATEPRVAVLVTTVIATTFVWMGNLNFVAPIITMFFLNTYGMINLAAGIERLVGNPSFRPQFKIPWALSLLGAAGCYGAMFLVNAPATVLAILISYSIFILLKRRSLQRNWGDIRSGIWFTLTRFGLVRLESVPWHVKNWRPNIVVFSSSLDTQDELMEMGAWLSSGRGIVTLYHLLVGDIGKLANRGLRTTWVNHIQKHFREHGVHAFAECSIVNDFYQGVTITLQTHGMAGLEPNVGLLGWGGRQNVQEEQLRLMCNLVALKKSVMFLHCEDSKGFGLKKRIDVWWRGRDRNAELMLLLAHIISQSSTWEGAGIRVLRLLESEEGQEGSKQHIAELLQKVRVEGEAVVLVRSSPEQSFASVLHESSEESDLVLLGMRVPEEGEIEEYARALGELIEAAGSALLVRSGEVEDILDTESGA